MNRLNEKLDLLVKLGKLYGPMQDLAARPNDYDEQERAETIARYLSEQAVLTNDFDRFSKAQQGHIYQIEFQKFYSALNSVKKRLMAGHEIQHVVADSLTKARDAINAVPVPKSSVILDAGTPFTAYCKLRALCEADATASIQWFDPYFDAEIFHRYVRFVNPHVATLLVACEPSPNAGKKNIARWNSFLDVSRLFAAEKGTNKYRLLIANSLHDRWLVLDRKRIYSLGGSAKDAASNDLFTITHIQASTENLSKIDDTLNTAAEWFGPTSPTHR